MRRDLTVCLLLAAAVAAVYWPVHDYPFVSYDDHAYVYSNPYVRSGLTADGLHFAFFGITEGNWHPVTTLSHMLDCQIFGVEEGAGWHHAMNLLLHIVNTLLLYVVLRRMTGAVWRSALVAALFGLHPLHVESVAWVAERKDVLSTLFFMLALLAYTAYVRRPSGWRYLPLVLAMALGLMCKPMLVTLPFVLLLLDYWPLGRMQVASGGAALSEDEAAEDEPPQDSDEALNEASGEDDEESLADDAASDDADAIGDEDSPGEDTAAQRFWGLVAEKVPLFLLAVISSGVTMVVQRSGGAMGMLGQDLPLTTRLANAVVSCGRYLEKSFWPDPLVVFYPYVIPRAVDVLIVGVALVAISVAAYRLALVKPFIVVGWCWYLGTLVPVLGLIQVGAQSMADRYTYIPLIGVFIIAAWGYAELTEKWPVPNKAALALIVLAVGALFTSRQVSHWSSSEALFRHAAESVSNNYLAHYCLAMVAWQENKDLETAEKQFQAALAISDNLEPPHRTLGLLYATQGRDLEALKQFDRAIALRPRQPDAYRHKAWLLATHPEEIVRDGKQAVELATKALDQARLQQTEYWDTLAAAYAEAGQFDDAVRTVKKAIEQAQAMRDDDMIPAIERRAALYAEGKPYHAPFERPKRP